MSALPDWPRAGPVPRATALARVAPADFEVEELLGFAPDGEGEHLMLWVEKTGRNTTDVAAALAAYAGIKPRDVGFCGLKDRRAVTRQWFSLGLGGKPQPDWDAFAGDGIRVLRSQLHRRKLRRGVHRGNRFRLRLCDLRGDREALEVALARVAQEGFPNYFGEQRFGRGGANLDRARLWLVEQGRAPRRSARGMLLSAARAALFNEVLAQRVNAGSWQLPVAGDVCMLDGSASFFAADAADKDLPRRAREQDIHVGLPLWGRGKSPVGGAALALQVAALAPETALCDALERAGVELGFRPARAVPGDFCWQFCDDALTLDFSLGRGSYATALLRELVEYKDKDWSEQGGE